ncbi:hypothetical protein QEN19_001849 [Hanseniaspora menglaensis]
MSFQNPFLKLGNDVEDSEILITKENIKTNVKNHKKEDVHPKADATKATGKKSGKLESNNNRSKEAQVGQSTKAKGSGKERSDKHSKSGKVDTQKKIRQGWGDSKTEIDAELDVEASKSSGSEETESAEVEESTPSVPTISMEAFLAANDNKVISRRAKKSAPLAVVAVEGEEYKGKKALFEQESESAPVATTADVSAPLFEIAYLKEEQKPKRAPTNNSRGKPAVRGGKKPFAKKAPAAVKAEASLPSL